MAFLEVNPKKLAFLISRGTHEGELRKFFTESKQQLLLRGAKVQNLPHGRDERTRVICERLSRKTDDVVRTWFSANVSVAAPISLDEVLLYLEACFDEEERLPETEASKICRSALTHLFEDTPDSRLLALLRRPMGPPQAENGSVTPQIDELSEESAGDSDSSPEHQTSDSGVHEFQLAELIASLIAEDEEAIDNALAPFPDRIRGLADALLRLRSGDADAAREQLALLPSTGPEMELVQRALARLSHQEATDSLPSGIRTIIPASLDRYPETTSLDVIGIYANETSFGTVFVEPLFIVLEDQLHHLSREDRQRLFPESGSVMSAKKALRWPFKRGALARWIVVERDGVEGKTRFHMSEELNPPIQVVRLSVPSSDADEVRYRVKEQAVSGRTHAGQQAIFLLSDNVAIVSPKGSDCTRDDSFDQPWQAWSSLETCLIEGSQYCLDVPRGSASNLDLSPLETAFKRLLRDLESESKLTLSKAQRRDIAELIRSRSGGEVSHRAKRIAASINQIAINAEDLEDVLNLLGSHEEVRRRVDDLVTKEFESRQAEKSGLQAEIISLKQKRENLEREARKIESSNRNQAESAAESVREAFEAAIRNGAATLANSEIFRILSNGCVGGVRVEEAARPVHAPVESTALGSLSPSELKTRLAVLGFNGRQASVLSSLAKLAEASGVALVLKGTMARECTRSLARHIGNVVRLVDIPMGLTSGDLLSKAVAGLAESKGLAILNADVAPFEVYGVALLDALMERGVSLPPVAAPILISCLGGEFSMPLPQALLRVSIVIDLDSNWDEGGQGLEEVAPDGGTLLPTLQTRVLELAASMDSTLRQHVERALTRAITHG